MPSVKLALTYASIKALMFLDHYVNLQVLEFNGLLNSSSSPLLVRILWQERSMRLSISPITKSFFHLPNETNHSFLLWGFNLVISDYIRLSALFSSYTSTPLFHPPFCSNANEDGKSLEDQVKSVVTSFPVPWKKLLQNFVFLPTVCKDCPVPFLHTGWMTGTAAERDVSCRHPHHAWSWSPPAGCLPGLGPSPYPGRCLMPRVAAAAPEHPGCSAPGWSSGMDPDFQALPCPAAPGESTDISSSQGAPPHSPCWHFGRLQVNTPDFQAYAAPSPKARWHKRKTGLPKPVSIPPDRLTQKPVLISLFYLMITSPILS